jgi:hypothetical protein
MLPLGPPGAARNQHNVLLKSQEMALPDDFQVPRAPLTGSNVKTAGFCCLADWNDPREFRSLLMRGGAAEQFLDFAVKAFLGSSPN